MTWISLAPLAWFAVSIAVGLLIGRAIHLTDEAER